MMKFFTKTIIKPYAVPAFIVFNVDNFNTWFRAVDNNAVYANYGIYLRLDKLSISQVYDYLDKCYGIEDTVMNRQKYSEQIDKFYREIRDYWICEQ